MSAGKIPRQPSQVCAGRGGEWFLPRAHSITPAGRNCTFLFVLERYAHNVSQCDSYSKGDACPQCTHSHDLQRSAEETFLCHNASCETENIEGGNSGGNSDGEAQGKVEGEDVGDEGDAPKEGKGAECHKRMFQRFVVGLSGHSVFREHHDVCPQFFIRDNGICHLFQFFLWHPFRFQVRQDFCSLDLRVVRNFLLLFSAETFVLVKFRFE